MTIFSSSNSNTVKQRTKVASQDLFKVQLMNNSVTLGLNLLFSVSGSTLLEIFLAVSRLRQATNWPQVNRYLHQPLTSYTIKSHRGLYRSVVHYKIIPTSDREVLCPLRFLFSVSLLKGGLKSKAIVILLLYLQYPKPKWAAFCFRQYYPLHAKRISSQRECQYILESA